MLILLLLLLWFLTSDEVLKFSEGAHGDYRKPILLLHLLNGRQISFLAFLLPIECYSDTNHVRFGILECRMCVCSFMRISVYSLDRDSDVQD